MAIRRHAIIWTYTGELSIRILRTNFGEIHEIQIKQHQIYKKKNLKFRWQNSGHFAFPVLCR